MGIKEILLIIACVAIVVGVSAGSLIRKKKGKGGCASCGASCPYAGACGKAKSACTCGDKKTDAKEKNPAANKLTLPISIPTLNGRPQKRASVYFCASFQSQKRSGLILWRNATF